MKETDRTETRKPIGAVTSTQLSYYPIIITQRPPTIKQKAAVYAINAANEANFVQ